MKVYEEVSGVLSLRHFGLAGWCSLSSPACFLSDISGWRDGALYPLAGGGRRIRRGAFWLRRRDAARPARADGEAAGGAVEISVLVNLVRGDDGARAVGATDDDASPVRRGASYGVSFATTRSQQLAGGPVRERVNHSFRDSSRARRRRAAGRIQPELWTAAPADFFLT